MGCTWVVHGLTTKRFPKKKGSNLLKNFLIIDIFKVVLIDIDILVILLIDIDSDIDIF